MANPELVTMLRMHQFEVEESQLPRRAQIQTISPVASEASMPPVSGIRASTPESFVSAQTKRSENKSEAEAEFVTTDTAKTMRLNIPGVGAKNKPGATGISNSIASASAMAGSAAAFAKGFIKTNFAKLHADHAPPSGGVTTGEGEEGEKPSAGGFGQAFRRGPQYSQLNRAPDQPTEDES